MKATDNENYNWKNKVKWTLGSVHTYIFGDFSSNNPHKMETMLKEEENGEKKMCLLGPG
jgi:hypothetical protein